MPDDSARWELRATVLVGNPGLGSRTRGIAETLCTAIVDRLDIGSIDQRTVDLAEHTKVIFDWGSPDLQALVEVVAKSHLLVVASPTFKASYSGLLKAFLDPLEPNGLKGVVAIPMMTGASPVHALAPDTSLRPLLVELDASVPTRSLYVQMSQLDRLDAIISDWLDANDSVLATAVGARDRR